VQEAEKRRQLEGALLWQRSMVERIFEEEGVEAKIKLCFYSNSRTIKEKL